MNKRQLKRQRKIQNDKIDDEIQQLNTVEEKETVKNEKTRKKNKKRKINGGKKKD